jgi:uncharacterized protein (TIGR02246 family)
MKNMRIDSQSIVFVGIVVGTLMPLSLNGLALGEESHDAIAQIRKASSSYLEALNRGDPKQIASFWTPQGTFVDTENVTHHAQDLVRQEFSKGEDGTLQEQRSIAEHPSTVRLITPDVAIEQGSAGPKQPEGSISPGTNYIAIWVHVKDRWLLDYLKELSIPPLRQAGHLDELAWMVGHWECQADSTDAQLSVSWSDQKQFLIQKFTVQLPGQDELRGEQRIAWDPSSGQIRSWLFRSDGGFIEGVWEREGETWVVKKTGVMPDGQKTSTVSLWVHEAPDTCWFKSLNARIGNKETDDVILQFTRTSSPKSISPK